jgi:uncharacterized protein
MSAITEPAVTKMDETMIDNTGALRARYPEPKERARKKQLDHLDRHCASFIALSPFVVIASGGSSGSSGSLDASPRGGAPGFIRILDKNTLLIPDAPGNNRLDTLTNIVESGSVGLLFLIPGVDESLRVNGRARLTDAPEMIRHFSNETRQPKLVIVVDVAEAYLHCAKALMRAKLWDAESRVDRAVLPTMGEMIKEQAGLAEPAESQAQMLARYANDL